MQDIQIETLKRLRLRDGDIVVLKHPTKLTITQVASIRQQIDKLKELINIDFKVIILDEGMDLDVIITKPYQPVDEDKIGVAST